AVLGISGYSFRSWEVDEASTSWLLDFLPNDIPEVNIITFGHNLPVDDPTIWSISDQAEFLLQELVKTREKGPKRDFHINIASFYEELPMPEIGVVTDKLAVTLGDTTVLPLHANHSDICRINSSSDVSYQRILGELKRLVRPNVETPNTLNFHASIILEYLRVGDGREAVGCAFRGTCNWIFTHTERI
ncbi:hypothetical protein Egran_00380, partial [Elaphomyces granulatus]